MKTLIIAEKPDMGRTIAAVVEPKAQNKRTYLEGERYIITWAIGHLVSLAEPDQYDPKYKRWNEADLPIIPDRFKLWPNARTKDQLTVIGDLSKRCGRLVNACDAGREGQLIFHLIRQYLKLPQPTDRLWISDLTPETIRRGFDGLRSDAEYDDLTRAARARSEADWLVGMNASRAFTIRHKALLSVGRVQTPVLALLYDRHKEITAFNSETFFIVQAAFSQLDFDYKGIWQGDRITKREEAEALAAKVKGKPGRIVSYTVNESKEYPYRLYDLTLLQREANGRYGYPAKKTLDIAQALYEKHKVITYPRTSSNYVTEENIPVMGNVLQMLKGTSYADLANGADRSRVHKGNRAVCNPAKVEDHHAILPTPKKPGTLSAEEQHIYDMIVRRFLSHYYPPAVYNNHEVITEVEGESFRTRAKEQLDIGWRVVLDQAEGSVAKAKGKGKKKSEDATDDGEDDLVETDRPFSVNAEQPVHCDDAAAVEKETKPPKPYTEGTLLKAMESAGKSIEDEELRDAMKQTGLGTPATRAATIERLKQVGYITTAGKRLDITIKGCTAIELIRGAGVELLASPEMTGRWEQRLHQISKGEASDEQFIAKVKQFAEMIVAKVKLQQQAAANLFDEPESAGKSGAKGKGRTSKTTARKDASPRKAGASAERGSARSKSAAAGTRSSRSASTADGPKLAASSGTGARAAASRGSASRATGRSGSEKTTAAVNSRSKELSATGNSRSEQPTSTVNTRSEQPTSVRPASTQQGATQSAVAPRGTLAACPRPGCGGQLIEGKRGYGCLRFREGCTFVIWKEQQGKTITPAMAKALAESGESRKSTFKLGDGTTVSGKWRLTDPSTGTIAFQPSI
ncbi:DNA topoisomerase 3 [Paenibacillus glycinis]|uniref:DNA topoisomerase n=1 Tax=Paenibacillus glycinis TaxID=2697035 RepID=A0ABW9XLH3_9BACL|nr:DNA topoisomerase 3 [Paenibacillus glycinis]NBD23450.1 DNA topoisomerase III [Paenibacillus glycinis]